MSTEISRPRGRPRGFDEREALEQAVRVFWSKGYDGATLDDLCAGMGVARPSLYATFGDKATLFMRCLNAYAERLGAGASAALLAPPGVGDGVRGLLRYIVESTTRDRSPRGCLMTCAASSVDDPKVREFIARANMQTVSLVEERLRGGVESGELPRRFPTSKRARLVMDLIAGLAIRARIGASRAELLKDAEDAASLLLESNDATPGDKKTRVRRDARARPLRR